jgi:glycosyltransferase involved in cell wall biosynthesis/peptidoglycan/xylan/chitin deacetylase (PgdA/CDA1 family)
MLLKKAYYTFKFLIPRWLQIQLRRYYVSRKRSLHADKWPIDHNAAKTPEGWSGWPDGKKFALVLTHDVESAAGLDKCYQLAEIEERLGFRSSFNFVAGDYSAPAVLRQHLTDRGFEIGIHGLHHKKNPFRSRSIFQKQFVEINRTLKDWGAVGFRSPSMYHDLELLHYLDIEYDASTFDTDPFEPQPDGMGTIFPFWVADHDLQKGYVELPYTLPQDFLLFILMQENNIDIWKRKLDWIVEHGGMAMFIVHPDYINFDNNPRYDRYPVQFYQEFLSYVKARYENLYWQALPRDVSRFWAGKNGVPKPSALAPCPTPVSRYPSPVAALTPIHACMLVYSFYESDNRVMRYAEALVKRGDSVDVIALGNEGTPRYEEIRGVKVYRIQKRMIDEKGRISYLQKLIMFLFNSSIFLTKRHLKNPYDLIHVHSVPDFEVFATIFPKLQGAKIVLDIHDIVPEFYASKFHENEKGIFFKTLVMIERLSCKYADYVIISNHLWEKTILSRSVDKGKCTVIMNYPDESIFYQRPRERNNDKFVMTYPGTLGWHQGLDIAIRAFALIKEQAQDAEFHIYGRGPEKKNLERLISELGLENRVFIKETMPIEQIARVMANADLGIIPKRNDPFGGEAFSTKTLEFMSLGVPIIVSETKIDKFYFNDSVLKFFKPEDVNDLAQAMLSMINKKVMRDRLRENAQRFVEGYHWENRKREYFDLVDSLKKDKRGSYQR